MEIFSGDVDQSLTTCWCMCTAVCLLVASYLTGVKNLCQDGFLAIFRTDTIPSTFPFTARLNYDKKPRKYHVLPIRRIVILFGLIMYVRRSFVNMDSAVPWGKKEAERKQYKMKAEALILQGVE